MTLDGIFSLCSLRLCGEIMSLMEKITVAIITKNEERNIRDCLESVKWADEIVVVDNGSTDHTLSICKEYGARIFQEEWKGYSGQKNSAIEKAGNEWVLNLDADERVSPELRQEMQKCLEENQGVDGYWIPRKNFFLGRWIRYCGWYPDLNLRLFRRRAGAVSGKGPFTNGWRFRERL